VLESSTISPAAPDVIDDAVSTLVESTLSQRTVLVAEPELLLGTAAVPASAMGLSDTESVGWTATRRRQMWTLTVACLGVTLVMSSMVALSTALGDIAVATSATQTQLTWVVDSYTLTLACLLLPAGAIGDRYGRRVALLVGLGIFSVASLVPQILHTPTELIVSRAVAGVGAAFVMPSTLSLLTAAYSKAQRAKAVGIWAGVAGSGAVLGMLGSGLLLKRQPSTGPVRL